MKKYLLETSGFLGGSTIEIKEYNISQNNSKNSRDATFCIDERWGQWC